MKKVALIFSFCFVVFSCNKGDRDSQSSNSDKYTDNPKLVVGIVVDQMRYDYLTRFYSKFGDGGFKRMMRDGFNCKNNHFNYVPTYTGPGHASIYTGTTPKYHGIIANDWYDKVAKKFVYCAADDSVLAVGSDSELERMSPHRLLTTTITDENRLFTQMRGKSIGISIKDRGAVLPAGHTANAAYWFRGKDEGNFISSTYYMEELPQWVVDFNASETAESYLKVWDTFYDISTYTESGTDLNNFEGGFKGKETAAFPYDLNALKDQNEGFDIVKYSPFGNSIVADFAIAAVENEQLGQDDDTDILTVSFSSTDYIGHNFGVNSKEIEDTYIRLDNDLERFFKFLDSQVGKGEYTVFLTADHGAVEVPSYLQSVKVPAGYLDFDTRRKQFRAFLEQTYGTTEIVENVSNNQVFLNKEKLEELNLNLQDVEQAFVNELITYTNIAKAYTSTTMSSNNFTTGIESLLQNGYNQKRSGDVIVVNDIAHIPYGRTGSTHGSGLNYDTHVPLLFFGKGIKQGETLQKTVIPDIAPTISALLGISYPNGATGKPLEFVLD
ncbi:MAG: alkaline phosphatase family protein [Winogradskyella sp.]|uniref:alkaline phosphatase PafA n=1 Tax=Winogradskyella sp. TaxID=1883156 RepID=UPI000F3F3D09|nr:alkaline phosphatase PafA [Winogradskyella sp.]RNC83461.1 MAG: alkaline phosphatase family protein [Winogradskyella sp.]